MLAQPSGQESNRHRLALRFISGKYQGGEFPLEENREIVIGRSSDLDMVLVEEMVSRKHAKLQLVGSTIHLQDLGSTNGTFVNGERISHAELGEGDRILIGSNILKVVALEEGEHVPMTRREDAPGSPGSPRGAVRGRAEGSGESRMSGALEEIPLPDLLQLFGTSKKSGVLVIDSSTALGRIYLRDGLIYHAEIESLSGQSDVQVTQVKAVYRMLGWSAGLFELDPPDPNDVESPLNASVQEVLMEGFRQKDEFEQIKPRLPAPDVGLALSQPLTSKLRDLEPVQLDVLQAAINAKSVQSTLDASPHPDLETAQALLKLIDKAYLVTQ